MHVRHFNWLREWAWSLAQSIMFPHARASETVDSPNFNKSRMIFTKKLTTIKILLRYFIAEYFLASVVLAYAGISIAHHAAYHNNEILKDSTIFKSNNCISPTQGHNVWHSTSIFAVGPAICLCHGDLQNS
jgi:hypothetical protein